MKLIFKGKRLRVVDYEILHSTSVKIDNNFMSIPPPKAHTTVLLATIDGSKEYCTRTTAVYSIMTEPQCEVESYEEA